MKTGEILKSLRLESNLTQKELAEKLGIGQSTIVGYERGDRETIATNLIKYANFFNVSTDYLLGRTDDLGNVTAMPSAVPALAVDERRLLECFRALEPDYKRLAIDTLGTWSGIPTKKGKTSRA